MLGSPNNHLFIEQTGTSITATLTRAPNSTPACPLVPHSHLTSILIILLYGVFPISIGVLFNYFVIFEHDDPSFMGLLMLQPAWALLSYCVAFALFSRGRHRSLCVSAEHASCTLTSRGVLFSSSRTIPLSSIRRFRFVTNHVPALNHEKGQPGTDTYGIEAVSLGPRLVFGYVLDKSSCVSLAEKFQTLLEDIHESGSHGCPPPSILPSLHEHAYACTRVCEDTALVSELPKGSVVGCRRWRWMNGHVCLVLRSAFPQQVALGTVLVNFEWYVTLVMSLTTVGTSVADVAGNGFVIVGSAIASGTLLMVFWSGLTAEKWVLGKGHVSVWSRFGVLARRISVAKVARVEVWRSKMRTLERLTEDEKSGQDCMGGRRFGIRLVGDAGALADFEMLTEGEALFIAGEIRKRYRDQFPALFEANSDTVV